MLTLPNLDRRIETMNLDIRSEAQSTQNSAFKEFCEDRASIRGLGVTTRELEALSRASLLGALSCKEDVLFMLQQIREKASPESPGKIDLSMPDTRKMTERLRRAALTNMKKRDPRDAIRNSAFWRLIRKMLGQDDLLTANDSTGY
jgi:hypothetical protein